MKSITKLIFSVVLFACALNTQAMHRFGARTFAAGVRAATTRTIATQAKQFVNVSKRTFVQAKPLAKYAATSLALLPAFLVGNNVDKRNELGYTQLFNAAQDNDVKEIRRLLKLGANPNKVVDDFGFEVVPPILVASRCGKTEAVLELMADTRTDLRVRSIEGDRLCERGGFTIILSAAFAGQHELLEVVIPKLRERMTAQEFKEFFNEKNDANKEEWRQTALELAKSKYDKSFELSSDNYKYRDFQREKDRKKYKEASIRYGKTFEVLAKVAADLDNQTYANNQNNKTDKNQTNDFTSGNPFC